ncbi:MAG: hypothetical protein RM338_12615 [Nostoc sp. DedQUE12a]|nr:hypothetical protein [Nostoc sp. DedQUE12a]
MPHIEEKVLDSTFEFSAPLTANSPELQTTERDRDRIPILVG